MKDVITAWTEEIQERYNSNEITEEQYQENLSWVAYLLTDGME